ncbi:hypothetical protein [Comamonas sp.]|uniref:hypothetical protein n=1 Tax=Comamonas sp. TaxID=34028 RepID=UPI0025C37B71|nr:hypothetical protein [Comamonas sp.]
MEIIEILLTIIALIGIGVSHMLIRKSLSSYASEKGKNLATKEDIEKIANLMEKGKNEATKEYIEEITRLMEQGKNTATKADIAEITHKIESTKIALQKEDRNELRKYELKYTACMKALSIVDALLSHKITCDNNGKPINIDKQYVTAEEIRNCHNGLILAVDNGKIVSTFLNMMTGNSENIVEDLDLMRELIRGELGFCGLPPKNEDLAWIGISVLKPIAIR